MFSAKFVVCNPVKNSPPLVLHAGIYIGSGGTYVIVVTHP